VPGSSAVFSVTVPVQAGGSAVKAASIAFGDGGSQSVSTSGTSSASHVYWRGGTYIVTAVATDTAGESTTAAASVSVQEVVVQMSSFDISPSVLGGSINTTSPTNFSVAATTVPTGSTWDRYEWSYTSAGCSDSWSTLSSSTSRVFRCTGTATVSVRAVTTTGASGTTTKQVVVQ